MGFCVCSGIGMLPCFHLIVDCKLKGILSGGLRKYTSDSEMAAAMTPDEIEYIGLLEEWIQQTEDAIQKNGILSMKGFGVVDFCLCFGFGPAIESSGSGEFVEKRDMLLQKIKSLEVVQKKTWESQFETHRISRTN
jgi:hypothetical protein